MDGSRIAAELVVSDLGLRPDRAAAAAGRRGRRASRRRIANIHYDRGQLLWANLAIHEPPRYLAELDNPGVGAQPRLYWGPKDLDYLHLRYQPEIFTRGFASRRTCCARSTACGTRPARPAGSHIVGVEEFSAPRRRFSPSAVARDQATLHREPAPRVGALRAQHDRRAT